MENQIKQQLESMSSFEALHADELNQIKGGLEAPADDSNKNDSTSNDSKKHDKFD